MSDRAPGHDSASADLARPVSMTLIRVLIAALVIPMAVFTAAGAARAATTVPPRGYEVGILNSFNQGLSYTDSIVGGVRSELAASGKKVQVYIEYFDSKRILPDREHYRRRHELYKYIYRKIQWGAIICSGDDALDFLLQYEPRRKHPPVIFCGVSAREREHLRNHPLFTGIFDDWNLRDNLKLALRLFPKTRRAVFVHDLTTAGRNEAEDARALARDFTRIRFEFISGGTLDEARARIARLPSDAVLFPLPFTTDSAGQVVTLEEGSRLLTQASPVPALGLKHYQLGNGIVGGLLVSGREQGKAAARIALRIMNGERISEIPPATGTTARYMFDYVEMQKHGISESDLPRGSVVINKPIGALRAAWSVLAPALAVILLLSALVAALGWNILKRRKVEAELRATDEHKRQFYRDTILSVTDGKLNLVEDTDLEPYINSASLRSDVTSAEEAARARQAVRDCLAGAGLSDEELDLFIAGVGEAISNAVRHAVAGEVCAGTSSTQVWVGVCDEGGGIESLTLPRSLLLRGFSTKPSLGLGYTIMLDAVDQLLLATGPQGTKVVLVKGLTGPEGFDDEIMEPE